VSKCVCVCVCVRDLFGCVCVNQYKVYVEMGCEMRFIKTTVYMEAFVCVCQTVKITSCVASHGALNTKVIRLSAFVIITT